jgi:adenylate kinase
MTGASKKCLLFFGAPGSGKGTQSEALVKNYNFTHISTGDIFRENLKNETRLGLEAKKYIDKGNLVPDEITSGMVKETIQNLTTENFILDGYPRNIDQAEHLKVLSEELNFEIKNVIFLEVPDKVLFERLTGRRVCKSCGTVYHMSYKPPAKDGICDVCGGDVYQRKDDSSDVISHRLKTYEESTFPVKNFYEEAGILQIVDGQGQLSDIEKRIENIVKIF